MAAVGESGSGYKNPGDIEVRTFTLISGTGQVLDIEDLVLDFSVFQNIYEKYLTKSYEIQVQDNFV